MRNAQSDSENDKRSYTLDELQREINASPSRRKQGLAYWLSTNVDPVVLRGRRLILDFSRAPGGQAARHKWLLRRLEMLATGFLANVSPDHAPSVALARILRATMLAVVNNDIGSLESIAEEAKRYLDARPAERQGGDVLPPSTKKGRAELAISEMRRWIPGPDPTAADSAWEDSALALIEMAADRRLIFVNAPTPSRAPDWDHQAENIPVVANAMREASMNHRDCSANSMRVILRAGLRAMGYSPVWVNKAIE